MGKDRYKFFNGHVKRVHSKQWNDISMWELESVNIDAEEYSPRKPTMSRRIISMGGKRSHDDKENMPEPIPTEQDEQTRHPEEEEDANEDFEEEVHLEVDLDKSPPPSPKFVRTVNPEEEPKPEEDSMPEEDSKPETEPRKEQIPRHTHFRKNITHPDGTQEVVEHVSYYGEPQDYSYPCCKKYYKM
jgi:hypothetical protein